jgi:hypothetical protein
VGFQSLRLGASAAATGASHAVATPVITAFRCSIEYPVARVRWLCLPRHKSGVLSGRAGAQALVRKQ